MSMQRTPVHVPDLPVRARPAAPQAALSGVAALMPVKSRRPSRRDRARIRLYTQRLEAGEDPIDAAWAVLSDPLMGIARWRGKTAQPCDSAILTKTAAMFRRVAPELAADARAEIIVRLGAFRDHAIEAIQDVTRGSFKDPRVARTRLAGAELILRSLGATDTGSSHATATVNVTLSDTIAAKIRAAQAEVR